MALPFFVITCHCEEAPRADVAISSKIFHQSVEIQCRGEHCSSARQDVRIRMGFQRIRGSVPPDERCSPLRWRMEFDRSSVGEGKQNGRKPTAVPAAVFRSWILPRPDKLMCASDRKSSSTHSPGGLRSEPLGFSPALKKCPPDTFLLTLRVSRALRIPPST